MTGDVYKMLLPMYMEWQAENHVMHIGAQKLCS